MGAPWRLFAELVAQLALWLELGDRSVADPEATVKQQEDLAHRLQRLTALEREEFIRVLDDLANAYPPEERRVLRDLPRAVGIAPAESSVGSSMCGSVATPGSIDPRKLAMTIDRVAALIVRGEFLEAERLTKGRRLSAAELETAVASYGRRLVLPASGRFEPASVVEVRHGGPRQWSVWVTMWTEEGPSDLTLDLTLHESAGALYGIEINDLHVL